jgi:hypothetical protein
MRKLFTERTRLVVYVEASDLTRLTEKARSEGRTVVEWARETLLGELETDSELPRPERVRVAERRANTVGVEEVHGRGVSAAPVLADKPTKRAKGKYCKHGTQKGYRCWQCGGMAIIE